MATDSQYIQRRLITGLAAHLDHPEITMLVGPRQSGKTTILKQLDTKLCAGGRKTLWLNLDFEDDFRHVSSQGALLQKIRLELGNGFGVVFIDEIQRKDNAGLFLKGLYDQGLPWRKRRSTICAPRPRPRLLLSSGAVPAVLGAAI